MQVSQYDNGGIWEAKKQRFGEKERKGMIMVADMVAFESIYNLIGNSLYIISCQMFLSSVDYI